MPDFALVQVAMPTSTGTQDITVPGFGTPKGALFWATYGTVNGTLVGDAMFAIGGTDGVRSRALAVASEDNQDPTDTGNDVDTASAIITLLNTTQAKDGAAAFSSWITDGVRINWTDAPPAGYLLNVLLIGGDGVSNCYVGTAVTPTTIDTAATINDPNFEADVVLVWTRNNTVSTHWEASFGIVVNDGSNTQYAMGMRDANGGANAIVSSILKSARVAINGTSGLQGNASIDTFTSTGFNIVLRDLGGTATTCYYMAIKLNGISKKLLASASPTVNGNHTITGAGFTPQFGLMLQGEFAALDTYYGANNGEVFGLGAFTSAQSLCGSTWNNDGAGFSTTDCITDTKPVRLLKDNVDYMVASFSAFTNDGVTFNYTTQPGVATQRAVLFIKDKDQHEPFVTVQIRAA